MVRKLKEFLIILLVFTCISLGVSSQVYSTSIGDTSRINLRGLVFNTGVMSDNIRLVKDYFRASGYKDVPWGYNYDTKTKELVRLYQKNNNLRADGIAGKDTINKMNKDIENKGLKIGLRYPETKVEGLMIIINKSSNTLYLMEDGEIISSYPVGTGKNFSLTPNGKHKVVVKYKNPAWGGGRKGKPIPGGVPHNPLGTRWIGISYGGGNKYGIHGNSNPASIGKYISLGCIRMFNGDVEKLYEKVSKNTPVWIGEEHHLISYGVNFVEGYIEKAQ